MALPPMTSNCDIVESFFGVYLLYSVNPKYAGRIYIGYTVDPNRRIMQHNKGLASGGARRTNNRGPWDMVLIVHGFPNDISALRFEWAWQNPKRSRRLRNLRRKKPRESEFQYRLYVMLQMLRMGPWERLPLTVRWLAEKYYQDFQANMCPPIHMPVTMGSVCPKKVVTNSQNSDNTSDATELLDCELCPQKVSSEDALHCIMPGCQSVSHIICLSRHFIGNPEQILPVEGNCPRCNNSMLWGDLIRKKKGCLNYIPD